VVSNLFYFHHENWGKMNPFCQAGAVRKALLALSELSGTGVERAKTARLGALLRAAEGAMSAVSNK